MTGVYLILIGLLTICLYIASITNWYQMVKRISVANRPHPPGLVWLILIPVLGQVWALFAIISLRQSVQKEFNLRQIPQEHRPSFISGMVMAISALINIIPLFAFIPAAVSLFAWMIFWGEIVKTKKLLLRVPVDANRPMISKDQPGNIPTFHTPAGWRPGDEPNVAVRTVLVDHNSETQSEMPPAPPVAFAPLQPSEIADHEEFERFLLLQGNHLESVSVKVLDFAKICSDPKVALLDDVSFRKQGAWISLEMPKNMNHKSFVELANWMMDKNSPVPNYATVLIAIGKHKDNPLQNYFFYDHLEMANRSENSFQGLLASGKAFEIDRESANVQENDKSRFGDFDNFLRTQGLNLAMIRSDSPVMTSLPFS